MSDYLDKIITKKKDGTQIASVPLQDADAQTRLGTVEDKLSTTLTPISGNPISISGLKSTQLAVDPVITFEPIQDLHGQSKPYPAGGGKNKFGGGVIPPDVEGTYWGWYITYSTSMTVRLIDKNNGADVSRCYLGITRNGSDADGGYVWLLNSGFLDKEVYTDASSHYISVYPNNQTTLNKILARYNVIAVVDGDSALPFAPYENICPISGYDKIEVLSCGKNLFDGTYSVTNKFIDSSGVETASNQFNISQYISVKPNTAYYFSNLSQASTAAICWYNKAKEYISGITINEGFTATSPANACYVRATILNTMTNICINEGNTAITYEPYHKTTDLSESLGQTVYGGSLDVRTGVLTVDRAIYEFSGSETPIGYGYGYRYVVLTKLAKSYNADVVPNVISNQYSAVTRDDISQGDAGISVTNDTVLLPTDNPTGIKLVYELATPFTIQLTPHEISLLEPYAYVSTNGTRIDLEYRNGMFATLSDLLDLEKKLTKDEPYGFIEHMGILDPAQRIEYIGRNKDYNPMTINLSGDHLANYNEWYDFFVLKENKPYMVKSDGTVDYALDPNDYTKKFDGSASDVANTSYTGGAFAWIPKIYKYEYVVGSDRYVYLSEKKLNDNYEAVGFIDEDGLEHDGVWIPMFYGTEITQNNTVKIMSLATGTPTESRDTATQKTYIENFSSKAKFFGGSIINVLADLLIMLGKNSDVQAVFGTGNMSGYNSSDAYYGMKANSCVNGGAFYGTTTNTVLNKAFHSLILLTQNQWQRDPYTLCYKGEYIVSPYYKYDLTGASYVNTGVFVTPPSSNNWVYPNKSVSVPYWGAVPVGPYSGSTTTGWADGQYTLATQLTDTTVRGVLRFADCAASRTGGVRCVSLGDAASAPYWSIGASPLLLSEEKTPA